MADGFNGFPKEATGFFRDLARNNNREWFLAHKDVYEQACREPLKALVTEIDPLGASRMTRINRDMRFARGRVPYKTHIASGVRGNYINLSSEGLWVGTGMYRPEPPALQQLRSAIDQDGSGRALVKIVATLRRKGYGVGTHDTVNSAPRGFAADHPRIDLLRMKDIFAGKLFEPGPVFSSSKLISAVKKAIADVEQLQVWLKRYVS